MIKEITTYDGNLVRPRNPYDNRLYTEVKTGKLYHCTECGVYFTTKPTEHGCQIPQSVV
jgi:hypothetical protein